MIKKIVNLFLIIAFLLIFSVKIKAEQGRAEEETETSDYGSDEVLDALPDDVKEELTESGITPDNSGALSLSPVDILSYLWNGIVGEAERPLKLLLSLTGIILLNAAAEALRDSAGGSQAARVFGIVAVISGAGMMCAYISDAIARAGDTLKAGGTFLATFVPVFAGIMAINGQFTTAPVFNSVVIVAAQLFTHLMVLFLIPVAGSILGISIAGAVNPEWKIERIAETVKKIAVFVLGLLITVFVGLLSIQTAITGSTDTVAMRAAKFTISNSVPIVGSAVSDALATVKGSVGLLKSSIGTFGILAGVCVVLPSLLSLICFKTALSIASAVSDLFGVSQLSSLLKSGESVMSIMLAMLFCFLLLTVISVSLMLFMGTGGAV